MVRKPSRRSPSEFHPYSTVPSTHSLTRREVLGATLIAGALGGDAAAQESDSGSEEATPTAGEVDWPTFQDGPRNAGYAPTARGPVDDGGVAWSHPAGSAGFSAPAVVDGTVYVGTLEGSVVALSAGDGDVRWAFETGDDVVSSPAVSDRRLFVGSTDGRVFALRRADGAVRWSVETGGEVRSSPAIAVVEDPDEATPTSGTESRNETESRRETAVSGTSTGGQVGERRVFVGSDDGTLYALRAEDGSVRWTYEVGRPVGSPAVRVPDDDAGSDAEARVYVGDREAGVYALSAVDGAERWTSRLIGDARAAVLDDDAVTAPTVAGDVVYAAAGSGGLYALSAADGSEQWQFSPDGPVGSPALAGDSLYVPVGEDGVYALSASDGTERWYESLGGDVGPPAVAGVGETSSSAEHGGTVYVTQGAGDVIVRALSAADGSQLWAAELDGRRAAAPAVVGETLYLNTGVVAAIDEVGRTPTATPAHTAWDGEVVLESWTPTIATWLGTYVGVPAVLGAIVYALGRFGRGDRSDDRGTGGGSDDPDGRSERGSDDDSAGGGST